MISREEAERIRAELLAVLAEDAHNTQRLLARLDTITHESGVGACSALLLILTHLSFEEQEARAHWESILSHRQELSARLGREAGVRVSILDYFMNVNRHLVQPTLIDLEMLESPALDASLDNLTGLATATAFRSALQQELRRARRYSQKTALVVMDLDNFAAINDRFGRLVGDRLLREAAILLSNKIRDIDQASRPGEDELALLLPETDRNGALLVAERFRREFEGYFSRRESSGRAVHMTLCAGVACYPDDAKTPEALLEGAAQALYQAKASGKNTVRLFHPERRRYLRFELEPGRFEVEVLSSNRSHQARMRNLSRNGILFASPAPLEVGEEIEIRLADAERQDEARSLRIRGWVVRLEELPEEPETGETDGMRDRFEIGVAFDLDWTDGVDDLLDFLERARKTFLDRQS